MESLKTSTGSEATEASSVSPARQRRSSRTLGQLQLSETVAMHLRERIISGEIAQGEFLRIDALANALGVSTTPVREGLLLLQSESSVTLIPRRGFVVNGFSKDDVHDLFWAQATLAGELARRATRQMSTAEVERLEAIQSEHEAAYVAGDTPLAARRGHEFHRAINLAARAPRLALLLGKLTKQLANTFYARVDGQLKDAVEYHPIILNAIRVRDVDAARSLMFRHVMRGGELLMAMLERQGKWSGSSKTGIAAKVPAARARSRARPKRKNNGASR